MNMNIRSIRALNFSLERTLDFIQTIEEQPSLYNPRDMSFKDGLLKQTIWQGIAQNYGRSVKECKRAWHYLKASFARYQRHLQSDTPVALKLKRVHLTNNYKLYKKLSFLEGIVLPDTLNKKSRNREPVLKTSENPIVVGMEHVMFANSKSTGPSDAVNIEPVFYITPTEDTQKPKEISSSSESEEPELDIRKKTSVKQLLHPPRPQITFSSTESDNSGQTEFDIRKKTSNIKNVLHVVAQKPKDNDSSESGKPDLIEIDIRQETGNVKKVLRRVDPKHVPLAIKRRHLEQSVKEKIRKPNETSEDPTIPLFVEHANEVMKRLPPLLQIQAKAEMFQVLTKYQMLALNGSHNTEKQTDIPTHTTNGSTSQITDSLAEVLVHSNSDIIKIEPNEVKQDPDLHVEVKPANVYDDVIEYKEEEMILP